MELEEQLKKIKILKKRVIVSSQTEQKFEFNVIFFSWTCSKIYMATIKVIE